MVFGTQLFGILVDQPTGTLEMLKKLKELGYGAVEPCVALDPVPGMEHVIWPVAWFQEHLEEIRGLGLEVFSCHLFAGNLLRHGEELVALARRGIRHFVLKSPEELTAESLQQASLTYMRLADLLEGTGAKVLLHNEKADIEAKFGGRTAYEYLLDLCLGKVFAQVDAGWVQAGGEDPGALLWRNTGRVLSLHYKDFKEGKQVPPGTGEVDSMACAAFARAMGIPQLLDQDQFPGGDKLGDLAAGVRAVGRLNNGREHTVSYLNTLDVDTGEVRVLRRYEKVIEAPNWLKNSNAILYNADGRMVRFDLDTGEETVLDTGICTACNNDHVASPDETEIAVSHMTFEEGFSSRVYIAPMAGGEARLVTPNSPSFLHGWSPDGEEMAYCAFREIDGKLEVDVYTIPAAGGSEKRLTGGGFNDGPEYSPDGATIWYNSTKSGLMQIWRMKRDGSEQTQITHNERNNWFGHVSPDGKRVAYISYRKGDLEPGEHLANMQVELWLMNADGSDQHRILSLFGGQGSMNVNSWAGDSRRLAFVSYELER